MAHHSLGPYRPTGRCRGDTRVFPERLRVITGRLGKEEVWSLAVATLYGRLPKRRCANGGSVYMRRGVYGRLPKRRCTKGGSVYMRRGVYGRLPKRRCTNGGSVYMPAAIFGTIFRYRQETVFRGKRRFSKRPYRQAASFELPLDVDREQCFGEAALWQAPVQASGYYWNYL